MNRFFNKFLALFAVLIASVAVSCNKMDETTDKMDETTEVYLDVTANNIQGSWELVSFKGEPLKGDTYFHISFDRAEKTYESKTNLNSIPGTYDFDEGTFQIGIDEELGAYIRGINIVLEEWSDRYIITELTRESMKWTGIKDPSNIMIFGKN